MGTYENQSLDDIIRASTLHFLNTRQVAMIDEALSGLGEYGEVCLVVEKGRLRFLVTKKSYDAFKWQPGTLGEDAR